MIIEINEERARELLADENAGAYPFQLISEDGLKYVRQELAKALGFLLMIWRIAKFVRVPTTRIFK